MNLYLISQNINNDYDTYDSAVVAAFTADEARAIHPAGGKTPEFTIIYEDGCKEYHSDEEWGSWCGQDRVRVELIGVAAPGIESGVILASYNAG
jgi:hypothetical protein